MVGQTRSTDGPRTDVADITTYAYYQTDDVGCSNGGICNFRRGDLKEGGNALGHITAYLRYDGAGRLTRMRDANGVLTDLAYDTDGRLSRKTVRANSDGSASANDAETNILYDDAGNVERVTEPDGSFVEYQRDDAHRLTGVVDNYGNRIIYTLDAAGNRVREETRDPNSVLRRLQAAQFDGFSRLKAQINAPYADAPDLDAPAVKKTSSIYDMNGNLDLQTDPLGRVVDFAFDELDRLKETVQDQGAGGINAIIRYEYDTRDNVRRITDPKALPTIYTYNGLDDLKSLQSPDTGFTTYELDRAGNRVTQTDARGIMSTMTYDAANRLTGIVYPDTSENIVFEYDTAPGACLVGERFSIGRLSRFTDESGATEFCYDLRGNLLRKRQTTRGTVLELRYTYNIADRLTGIKLPSGRWIHYGRDAAGRIVNLSLQVDSQLPQSIVSNVIYRPFGPVSQISWADGGSMLREYDQNYWPDSLQSSRSTGLTATFDTNDLGIITGIQSGVPLVTSVFGYDRMNRLETETRQGQLLNSYGYDATGNRTVHNGVAYGYNANSHRLGFIGNVGRSYDANGNLINPSLMQRSGPSYSYSDRNRMHERRVNGSLDTTYLYSARGERVYKSGSAGTTLFIYDEAGQLLGEYNATGATIREFAWLNDLPIALLLPKSWMPIEPDHLGSPRRVIDPQRQVAAWSWDLQGDAFGRNAPAEDPDGDQKPLQMNLRFPGQYFDVESGLHYNYFRDYEPGTGRYVESDPIGLQGGISTYAYAVSRPINAIDPFGLFKIDKSCDGCEFGTSRYGPKPSKLVIRFKLQYPIHVFGAVFRNVARKRGLSAKNASPMN
ncbi:MAG: RHS repeat protein [Ahniella sp.]|nr:RHS repeat protein [Ahniella sp.]